MLEIVINARNEFHETRFGYVYNWISCMLLFRQNWNCVNPRKELSIIGLTFSLPSWFLQYVVFCFRSIVWKRFVLWFSKSEKLLVRIFNTTHHLVSWLWRIRIVWYINHTRTRPILHRTVQESFHKTTTVGVCSIFEL